MANGWTWSLGWHIGWVVFVCLFVQCCRSGFAEHKLRSSCTIESIQVHKSDGPFAFQMNLSQFPLWTTSRSFTAMHCLPVCLPTTVRLTSRASRQQTLRNQTRKRRSRYSMTTAKSCDLWDGDERTTRRRVHSPRSTFNNMKLGRANIAAALSVVVHTCTISVLSYHHHHRGERYCSILSSEIRREDVHHRHLIVPNDENDRHQSNQSSNTIGDGEIRLLVQ